MLVLAVVGLVLGLAVPRAGRWLDRVAVDRAAREATMAMALARHRAIAWGQRTRLTILPGGLLLDTLGRDAWGSWTRLPGPSSHGVTLEISNPVLSFAPTGMAWGFSNTKLLLRRRLQSATITVSRVGRVKRW